MPSSISPTHQNTFTSHTYGHGAASHVPRRGRSVTDALLLLKDTHDDSKTSCEKLSGGICRVHAVEDKVDGTSPSADCQWGSIGKMRSHMLDLFSFVEKKPR